jgi:pimeloyl-ACP methyl ester carboxylesterase
MRRLDAGPAAPPLLEDVHFKSLYRKEIYGAPTRDGWLLQISRYRPVPQPWHQPILNEPLLLVPGWSQNRHAFTAGKFVQQLLHDGADVHIAELRGHGLSSRALQQARASREGRALPVDFDWGWDLDSYLLEDIPAAVAAVRARTGRSKVYYVGNSMGGMLGYGYAAQHDDLAGLVTIGAPSDIGRGFFLLRAGAFLGPAILSPTIDALLYAASSAAAMRQRTASTLRKLRVLRRLADRLAAPSAEPLDFRFRHVPVDFALRQLSRAITPGNLRRFGRLDGIARRAGSVVNPARVTVDDIRWLLREGGEKEPRRVIQQFARWIRNDEMVCYRTGFDYKAHFGNIRVPLAIIFGDLDKIASHASTRSIYKRARSEYLLWRGVKDNSHLELTMGYDVRQVCADIRDLVEHTMGRPSHGRGDARG